MPTDFLSIDLACLMTLASAFTYLCFLPLYLVIIVMPRDVPKNGRSYYPDIPYALS